MKYMLITLIVCLIISMISYCIYIFIDVENLEAEIKSMHNNLFKESENIDMDSTKIYLIEINRKLDVIYPYFIKVK